MKKLILLSGGLDSTIAMRFAVAQHGEDKVASLSFNYGQKQAYELICAKRSSKRLGVKHKEIDIAFLNNMSQGFSANTDPKITVPTTQEVIGNPQPKTYVPNRNMILLSIAASFAEVNRYSEIITGFQVHDEYGYHDTTQSFVDSVNSALAQNRTWQITIRAPFVAMSKTEELQKLWALDGNFDLLKDTITCYNPIKIEATKQSQQSGNPHKYLSCARCPACGERLQAFKNIGHTDPIDYQ